MKKYFFLSFLLHFSSCQKSVPEFEMPKRENINEIINCVILSDSLFELKSFKTPEGIHHAEPIYSELGRLQIRNSIVITELLSKKVKNQTFFSSEDSTYLQFQNKHFKKFRLGKGITNNVKQIDLKLLDKHELYASRHYCLSIPYFSLDKSKAFITVTHECPYMCSSAYAYFLKKQNGKWKIINSELLWIS